jgi:peptidoglycan/xylan/chitin deacetylase (PgdA/CDA1 family)
MKKALPGLCRALKPILFFLCLTALFLVGIVSAFRQDGGSEEGLSLKGLWSGSYLSAVSDRYDSRFPMWSFYHTDRVAPTITLLGEKNPTLEKGKDYTTLGYLAQDNFDGDITDQVTVEELDNQIAYTVSDQQGNTTTVYRDVTFVDTTAPELTLTGGSDYDLPAHTDYVDPGYTALDLGDGDISAQVTVTGDIDNRMLGDNVLTYTVTDSAGNTATATRTVHVVANDNPDPITDEDKVIYLTFDDGPGPYTQQLLDVLDKYDVKVTFFVTGQFSDYFDMIGEEAKRGHTVAIHSYTHDFYTVYASVDDYFADFDRMQEIIQEQTGQTTNLFRFPGGSSNTISSFNPGVVSSIAARAEELGYHYFDWNCSSGDASGTELTPEQVVSNVTSDIANNPENYSVVLQHDIKEFSVNAVEDIILWGLDNGYIFRALDETSPGAHHGINN